MKIRNVLLATLIIGSLASCTKPIDPMEPIDVTKNAFLVDRIWRPTAHKHTTNIDVENPVYFDSLNNIPDCKKDNYLEIITTNTGFINDYFIKCLATDPQETPVFYSVTENDSYIKFYTDDKNIDGTTFLQGVMTTPTINKFIITYRYYNTSSELTESGEITFERFYPDF